MLARKSLRPVTVKKPRKGYGMYAFEKDGKEIYGAVQPMSGDLAAKAYGAEPSLMLRMLCWFPAEIQKGDGVCVDVAADADPDYVVVHAPRWSQHVDVHLKFIPEAKRGADE